jgi:non-canonical purine NTP pyrophosphatase (RdgB/HAM1 family)
MTDTALPELLAGAVLVTGNPGKLAEARRICGVGLEAVEMELPELQSLDLYEVLRAKGREAIRRLRRPVVVEETGLELAALGGFPGPLVKWMLEAVGAEGIARTASVLGDTRAVARCALLYLDDRREVEAEGTTEGELVAAPRGDGGFGWDPVFLPDGESRTYGEMSPAEKDRLSHRARAWRAFVTRLAAESEDQS